VKKKYNPRTRELIEEIGRIPPEHRKEAIENYDNLLKVHYEVYSMGALFCLGISMMIIFGVLGAVIMAFEQSIGSQMVLYIQIASGAAVIIGWILFGRSYFFFCKEEG
jgi:cytochrome c biogenesis protein CcdA